MVFADLRRKRIVRRVRVGSARPTWSSSRSRRALIVASGRDLVSVDVATGRVHHMFTAPFPIEQLAGPPGRSLAIADKYRVAIVDLHTGSLRVIARGDPSVNVVNGMMWASPATGCLSRRPGRRAGHGNLFAGLTVLDAANGTRQTVSLARNRTLAAVNFLRVSPTQRTWFITGAEINANNNSQVATTWAVDARYPPMRGPRRGPLGATASPVQASPGRPPPRRRLQHRRGGCA